VTLAIGTYLQLLAGQEIVVEIQILLLPPQTIGIGTPMLAMFQIIQNGIQPQMEVVLKWPLL
jgi:hypothetical protein